MFQRRTGRTLAIMGMVLSFVFMGCSARQEIVLTESGAGHGRLDIRLDPVFVAYLSDISAGFGASSDAPLFDVSAVEAAFAERPGIALTSVEVPQRDRIVLEIAFNSVEDVLALEGQNLTRFLRFERTQEFRRIAAEIDRRAVEHFSALGGLDPVIVESLLPPEGGMTRREYQDHLAWALEEYTSDRSLDEVFRDSTIVTELVPAGEIVRLEGGVENGDGVTFSTSLVEAVVTPVPLRYSLVFLP